MTMTMHHESNQYQIQKPALHAVSTSSVTLRAQILVRRTSNTVENEAIFKRIHAHQTILFITVMNSSLVYTSVLRSITPSEIARELTHTLKKLNRLNIEPDHLITDFTRYWRSDDISRLLQAHRIVHVLAPTGFPKAIQPKPPTKAWLH